MSRGKGSHGRNRARRPSSNEESVERVGATLVHEARHTRQARWCGLGLHPWLGMPVFAVLYLALPLPIGLGIARFLFELDADRAAWRHTLAVGAPPDQVRERAREFASRVCSGHYGWPVPRRLGVALFARAAEREITFNAAAESAREAGAQRCAGAGPARRVTRSDPRRR